ncbi:hypothetical protein BT67DRAFT_216244 [Trichocladium antarcticum]|uniref:Uncharacterized protein n=1 Tax=Trichocladium antarcticum TaxID=1450529 RepID=A0AAN6ZAE2_9PEZI|nr:hypothetical protein BT67DRAFT_216244 [Trichocladium antarcticum]
MLISSATRPIPDSGWPRFNPGRPRSLWSIAKDGIPPSTRRSRIGGPRPRKLAFERVRIPCRTRESSSFGPWFGTAGWAARCFGREPRHLHPPPTPTSVTISILCRCKCPHLSRPHIEWHLYEPTARAVSARAPAVTSRVQAMAFSGMFRANGLRLCFNGVHFANWHGEAISFLAFCKCARHVNTGRQVWNHDLLHPGIRGGTRATLIAAEYFVLACPSRHLQMI